MFTKPNAPQPETLPPWAKGRVTLSAFRALKETQAPHGYRGKPATMRKLQCDGLVREIAPGVYSVTEAGRDLIEGSAREPMPPAPPEMQARWREEWGQSAFPLRVSAAFKEAAEEEHAPAAIPRSYAVERVEGGCEVIRFPARRLNTAPRR